MSAAIESVEPSPAAGRVFATRAVFFVAGFGLSSWAPLVPYVKARLAIGDGLLGLLLLCLGIGSLVTMPVTGVLAGRFGCRRVILGAGAALCIALPLLAFAGSLPQVAIAIALLGASVGTLDVAMNIQAVRVEAALGRAMMSGFHGFFSIGGIAGAGAVTLALGAGAAPGVAALLVAAVSAALLAASANGLLREGVDPGSGPRLAVPSGVVILIGLLCCACFLTEGAMLDWSAVFLTGTRHFDARYGGAGYALFSVAMTVCRFTGDRVVAACGGLRVLRAGAVCAAAGLLLAVLVPSGAIALLGFVLVGIGASNMVPVLFTAAGRQRAMPANLAVAAVTTLGYAGILAGPALIGAVAQATSLPLALALLAAMMLAVASASGRLAADR
jgi:hypothetical protein